jgi:Arabinose-binding domain of AraC transcription regulator, N-term
MLRKRNITTAPLLLRAGLSEHGLVLAADESDGLAKRVSAVAQCRFLEYAAEAMDESAFGLHLAKQIDPRDVGLYFYASSAAEDTTQPDAVRRAGSIELLVIKSILGMCYVPEVSRQPVNQPRGSGRRNESESFPDPHKHSGRVS